MARRLSFTRAAEELGLSQPTVSTQVRQLSDEIGMPLFEQLGKTVYLTDAGKELLVAAQAVRSTWSDFEANIAGLQGLTRGTLKLACVTTAKYFAPELLGAFCERYPEVEVRLEIANRDTLFNRMRANLDDVYITSLPPEDIEVEDLPFQENALVVVASMRHPLSGRRDIDLASLAPERFILRENGSGTREIMENHFGQHGFVPRVRMEMGSNEAIKHAVAGGLGISVLSRYAIDANPAHDRLCILDVQGFPLYEKWHLVYPKGKRLSAVCRSFLGFLGNSLDPAAAAGGERKALPKKSQK